MPGRISPFKHKPSLGLGSQWLQRLVDVIAAAEKPCPSQQEENLMQAPASLISESERPHLARVAQLVLCIQWQIGKTMPHRRGF
jgi:hypothetical protein